MNYYEGIDYWVRYVDFPNMASESVVASHGDGTFTIYINTLFPPDRQAERLEHELRHLADEHFYRDDLSIAQVEHQADGIKEHIQALPNVFDHAPGVIPVFNSLDAFRDYMYAMREQVRSRRSARER